MLLSFWVVSSRAEEEAEEEEDPPPLCLAGPNQESEDVLEMCELNTNFRNCGFSRSRSNFNDNLFSVHLLLHGDKEKEGGGGLESIKCCICGRTKTYSN